MSDFDQIKSL